MSGQLNKHRAKTMKTTITPAQDAAANAVKAEIKKMLASGCYPVGQWVSKPEEGFYRFFVTIHGVQGLPPTWEPSNNVGIKADEIHNTQQAVTAIVDDLKRQKLTGIFKD